MDFGFTPEQDAWRKEVRDFLAQELPHEDPAVVERGLDGVSPGFSRKIAEKGWIGLSWPKECGGQGMGRVHRLIFSEEIVASSAPVAAHWSNDKQQGPSLIEYGTEEQKKEYLPRMLKAELITAVGYSEPGAGSDLVSLKTTAVEDGSNFIINGLKTWTTRANVADICWLAARTDPNAPKHKGISEFIVDLKLPGITIRPIVDMLGEDELCEVSFKNVRVPATALVGEKNQGWQQINTQLGHERGGMTSIMTNRLVFEETVKYVREHADGKDGRWTNIKNRLAELEAEYEVGRLLSYQVAALRDQGRTADYE